MRRSAFVAAVLLAIPGLAVHGQEKVVSPNLSKIADEASWRLYNASAEAVKVDGKEAARVARKGTDTGRVGLALPIGVELATGTIEVELKGKNVKQRSFLGVAFNVVNETTFEAVYFRPFNFKAQDVFQGRAVQYIAWPEHTWAKLRESRPRKFEGPINPPPDPDGWFRARIEVGEKQVRVFVNKAAEPCLTVERLAKGGKSRPVGLFVEIDEGMYANLRVRPDR